MLGLTDIKGRATGKKQLAVKKNTVSSENTVKNTVGSRAGNWSYEEKLALVGAVQLVHAKLFGKFSKAVSQQVKNSYWKEIVNKVNAVGTENRGLISVKKQYIELKCKTRQKAALVLKNMKKTGGGELEDLSLDQLDEKLASMSSIETAIVKMNGKDWLLGIAGGAESTDFNLSDIMANEDTEQEQMECSVGENIENDEENIVVDEESSVSTVKVSPMPGTSTSLAVPKVVEKQRVVRSVTTPVAPKRPKREASEVTLELLQAEQFNGTQLKRIADSLEELVMLKRAKLDVQSFSLHQVD